MAIIDREFLRDTALVDRYLMPDSLAGRTRLPLHKVADFSEIASSFLGTVGGALSEWVTSEIAKFKGDPVAALGELAIEGWLGIYGGWFLTLVDIIAEVGFGFNFFSLFDKIKNNLVSEMKQNKTVNNDTVTKVINTAVGGGNLAEDQQFVVDAWEHFGVCASLVKNGAMTGKAIKWVVEKFMGKEGSKSWIKRLLRWLFLTILGSMAMTAKRQVVRNAPSILMGRQPGSGNTSEQSSSPSPSIPSWLKPSGFGTSSEGGGGLWEEDVPLATIQDTLVDWAIRVYPQLQAQRQALAESSALASVVNTIRHNNKENHYPSITWIPHHYGEHVVNSQKELVDLFVGEVANKMPEPEVKPQTKPEAKVQVPVKSTQ